MYPSEVRQLAALVGRKAYYHLGSYEDSVSYALDVTYGSQYVETIITKCIDRYIARRAEEGATIDNRLEDIVNGMFDRYLNILNCDLCSYNYNSQRLLGSHMMIHTDQTHFQCDDCYQSFRQKQLLKRH